MNVRAQVSTVFHLDKCIGCHTCSLACKSIWTDRKGTEYMWWNNVETKPGTGYPTRWEDQDKYKGGWEKKNGNLRLKLQGKLAGLANLFFNPFMPTLDDYYEPWTYRYEDLFDAPASDDQPTARPVSQVTGKPLDIAAGPNWDDDLGGSPVYAASDPNLEKLGEEERREFFALERIVFFYLPRICNHCANPGCVASCPAGAVYKRGEDGIVLVNQDKCRAWRMCISGCPYKKVYYNWSSGKSEKCILCFPRLESSQAPACFHSCVGRIRYLGVLLYDADRLVEAAAAPDEKLVASQRDMILDPFSEETIAGARRNNIPPGVIEAAQKSPCYRFVKEWKIALPLHPEFRTLPMLFYIPPLLPLTARVHDGTYDTRGEYFDTLERGRIPLDFLASLFAAGNTAEVRDVYRKLSAVRIYKRAQAAGDIPKEKVRGVLEEAAMSEADADAIFRLTSLASCEERFVIPPLSREVAMEPLVDPYDHRARAGAGYRKMPERRW